MPAIEEPPDDVPAQEEVPAPAPEEKPAAPAPAPEPKPPPPDDFPPVKDWLEAQVELSRRGFSCGSIDGVGGAQSAAALRAFQRASGLRESGQLDKSTKRVLHLTAPALAPYTFDVVDLSHLRPIPDTWVGKSQEPAMFYSTPLELAGERCRTAPAYLKKLNPTMNWGSVLPGTVILAPSVAAFVPPTMAARIHVRLADHVLEAVDEGEEVIFHCPVSIARKVEKRPVGELHVQVVIPNPVYTWDPELFPEYPESKELTHKLILPAGPNNPVGLAWIGLDRTGYGIHGTPEPENVGRTESHGCFRLANWDALVMLQLCRVGLPVEVEP
ncbi:MAG TPA: L,D-transpeptidase [Candidatus Didemnitutus sp.]|nr:L,D-transpeptidase [Candidatus Didemnitutus sp.]